MKPQYKAAVCSFVTITFCLVFSLFFVCFKDLFIDKWYDYLIGISLGLLTNSVLIFIISIINIYQIRREYSRRIFIELNIFQEEYYILNALLLPMFSEMGEISIPDSKLHFIENALARLNDITYRILYLDRISLPNSSFRNKHPGVNSKIKMIEDSFFKELSELVRQLHIANIALRLSYEVDDEPTRKMSQTRLQNSIKRIIELSDLEGPFDKSFKKYLEINKKILKITEVKTNESVPVE